MNIAHISLLLSLFAIGISVIHFLCISWPNRKNAKLECIIKYFKDADSTEAKELRKHIYNTDKQNLDKDKLRSYLSQMHFWGLMVKERLLPFSVFESISGQRMLQLHSKVEGYLNQERKRIDNYAENYLYLIKKLKKSSRVSHCRPSLDA